jgi:hypothetical protein
MLLHQAFLPGGSRIAPPGVTKGLGITDRDCRSTIIRLNSIGARSFVVSRSAMFLTKLRSRRVI